MFVVNQLLILCTLFNVYYYVQCEGKMKAPLARKRTCSDPLGNIGEVLIQGCRRKTCRRKGKKAVWVETIESTKCCNHDQIWYEMGETIKETQSTDNCTSTTLSCINNEGNSQIRIKTRNRCSQYLETEMREHANMSDRNFKNVENKIDGVETLLQIFLNKTDTDHSSPTYPESNTTSTKAITTTTTTKTFTTPPSPSQSQDVLFIGPGFQSKGKSEVLLLPSLTPANCTPPIFPGGNLQGYVARMTADGPLLCGGFITAYTNKCHLLANIGDWFGTPPLVGKSVAKAYMAAVEINDGWMVTGGFDGSKHFSTSEIWYNHTWNRYTSLPKANRGHCLVRLNSTHSFLTGGVTDQKTAYIFSKTAGFVRQADMITARYYHGCAMHGDKFVFVATGTKSEYFSLETRKWLPGPDLPQSSTAGKMITIDGKATFFGGQKIYQLEKIRLTTVDWWQWAEVGEMKSTRQYFDIIKMKMSDCENWN